MMLQIIFFSLQLSILILGTSSFFVSKYRNQLINRQIQLQSKKSWNPPTETTDTSDLMDDDKGLAFEVALPRASGINWSSDLSFRWVYVSSVEQSSPASDSGLIQKVLYHLTNQHY